MPRATASDVAPQSSDDVGEACRVTGDAGSAEAYLNPGCAQGVQAAGCKDESSSHHGHAVVDRDCAQVGREAPGDLRSGLWVADVTSGHDSVVGTCGSTMRVAGVIALDPIVDRHHPGYAHEVAKDGSFTEDGSFAKDELDNVFELRAGDACNACVQCFHRDR